MDWKVIWTPVAEDQLAEGWLTATDRESVRRTSYVVDEILQRDPYANSESREGNQRILVSLPLIVDFLVQADVQRVMVIGVRVVERKK